MTFNQLANTTGEFGLRKVDEFMQKQNKLHSVYMNPLESPRINNQEKRERASRGKTRKTTNERRKKKTTEGSVYVLS